MSATDRKNKQGLQRVDTLEAFGAALRRKREELGFTLDEVARKTGISKPYLSNIETARAPGPPSEEKLRLLAGALSLDAKRLLDAADWLRTPASVRRAVTTMEQHLHGEETSAEPARRRRRDDGSLDLDAMLGRRKACPSQNRQERLPGDAIGIRKVPVINKVTAGQAAEFGDMSYPAGVADEYVPAPDLPDAPVRSAFALRVTGDSMMPEYREGEILIVGPGDAEDGDDAVVRLGAGENFATTFKRVFFMREGEEIRSVRLMPLNPKYAVRDVAIEEVTGIYPLMYRVTPARRGAGANAALEEPKEAESPREFTSRVSIEHD